jgi:hypothetical protein
MAVEGYGVAVDDLPRLREHSLFNAPAPISMRHTWKTIRVCLLRLGSLRKPVGWRRCECVVATAGQDLVR